MNKSNFSFYSKSAETSAQIYNRCNTRNENLERAYKSCESLTSMSRYKSCETASSYGSCSSLTKLEVGDRGLKLTKCKSTQTETPEEESPEIILNNLIENYRLKMQENLPDLKLGNMLSDEESSDDSFDSSDDDSDKINTEEELIFPIELDDTPVKSNVPKKKKKRSKKVKHITRFLSDNYYVQNYGYVRKVNRYGIFGYYMRNRDLN